MAKLPEGQSVYSDGTENGPSASSRTALTSGPRPTSSAKYGPSISAEDCQEDSEAYENSGHVIDHFDYCATSYFVATFRVCTTGWFGTSCKTTGTASWRQTVLGRGYNNPDKVTRYVDFVDVLDEWKLTGDAGTHSMTVGMSCLTQVGADCMSSYDALTQTLAQWAVEPSTTYFRFDSPATGGFGDELIGQYDFQTKVSLTGGTSASFATNTFRCDSAPYIINAAGSGCVFPDVNSIFSLSVNSNATQEALHIWQAQYHPATTTPTDPNKRIPGSVDSLSPLTRLADPLLIDKNRNTAVATATRSTDRTTAPGARCSATSIRSRPRTREPPTLEGTTPPGPYRPPTIYPAVDSSAASSASTACWTAQPLTRSTYSSQPDA